MWAVRRHSINAVRTLGALLLCVLCSCTSLRQLRIENMPVAQRMFVYSDQRGDVRLSHVLPGVLVNLRVLCHETEGLDVMFWQVTGHVPSEHGLDLAYGDVPPGLTEEYPARPLPENEPCGVFVDVVGPDQNLRRAGVIFVLTRTHGFKAVEGNFESVNDVYDYFISQVT
jgi:hypothetical protein